MFDARSLIEAMMKGGAPAQAPQAGGMGGLGDILGQVLGGGRGGSAQAGGQAAAPGGAGGLENILRDLLQQGGGQGSSAAPVGGGQGGAGQGGGSLADILRQMVPQGGPGGGAQAPGQGGGMPGGLGEILGKLGGGAGAAPVGGASGGSLMDILGQVLNQATQGVKEGAQRIDGATGASGHMRDAVGRTTGQSPQEMLAKLQELIANNQLAAGAGLGGLGALVLGTKTGRSAAASAAKLGALALIGGLAYKAYHNYSQGRPLLPSQSAMAPQAAPSGSGFEEQAVTQDAAVGYIRAMIAAAAADGRLDASEQSRILGSLQNAGLGQEAEEFLANEINNPATPDDLAQSIRTPEEAVQLYTAARITIDPDTMGEKQFLAVLAQRLGIDQGLAAHIDAEARAA